MSKNYRLIVASKSPRRSQLLADAGFEFVVQTKEVEENYPPELAAADVPAFLSQKKSAACADFLTSERDILLTADSVVVLNGQIYEKPTDDADAFRIIKSLSGNMHEVVTGVTLRTQKTSVTFSESTKVFVDEMTDAEIWHYVRTAKPFDKAGAYAIQEWVGLAKIPRIEGSFYNVMGLPVHLVYREIAKLTQFLE